MPSRVFKLAFLCLIAAAPLHAAAPEIDHKAVACIIAGKYPRFRACFGTPVSEPRTYFHAEGVKEWFYVKMAADQPAPAAASEQVCYSGVLPRPSRKLIHRHVWYYIELLDKDQRTPEYDPLVVRRALECKKDAPVAPISPTGPTAVFPSLSVPGFTVSSFPTAAVVGGTIAVGGATGLILSQTGGEPGTTSTPTGTPPAAPPPPSPAPPPPPPTTPPAPLAVSCAADPQSGQAPLTVLFSASASGGTGSYDFAWKFGDGGSSTQVHPTHTYTSPDTYTAVVNVTSGDLVRPCEKNISVLAPPPPPPTSPPAVRTLTFTSVDETKAECGVPKVNIAPPKKDCLGMDPGTVCTETYPVGTVVTLTADDLKCGDFICWTGDCLGAPSSSPAVCTLTMDSDKVASATFLFNPPCVRASSKPGLLWMSVLDVPGAGGQITTNGTDAFVADVGHSLQALARTSLENRFDATLLKAAGKPGTWRFDLQDHDAVEPGSLKVLRGDVELVTNTSVTFRLRGQVGEQVSFSFRLKP